MVETGDNGNVGSRQRDCMANFSNEGPSAFCLLHVQLLRLHGLDRTCMPLDNGAKTRN